MRVKYRIIKRATRCTSYPFKHIVQKKVIAGWKEIDWNYGYDECVYSIRADYAKILKALRKLPKDEIVKEFELTGESDGQN